MSLGLGLGTQSTGGGALSFADDLLAFWPMDEVTSTGNEPVADKTAGGYGLTPTNTVPGAATGRTSGRYVRVFDSANSEYLTLAAGSHPFNFWNQSWSCATWFKPTDTPGVTAHIASVWKSDAGADRCWALDFSTGRIPALRLTDDGTNLDASAVWGSALTVDQWYHLSWGYDAENDIVWIAVDNGTRVTTSHTTGTYGAATLAPFMVGSIGQTGNYLKGEVGEFYFANKTMSTTEVLELYDL